MDVTFELPGGEQLPLDQDRAAFLAEALRLRASGEFGKIAEPDTIRALATAIEARCNDITAGPLKVTGDVERDMLLAILNVAAMGDNDRALRELHRAIRGWWSEARLGDSGRKG